MLTNKYDIVIYEIYEKILENTNEYINSINSNTNNLSEFNFKIDDQKTNKILKSIYSNEYINYLEKNILNHVDYDPDHSDKLYILEHEIPKPSKINKFNDRIELSFHFPHHSKIFSNMMEDKSSTNFTIKELHNINKNDYAYTTLLFPNYNKFGKKNYDYLLGCLLVTYLLKNKCQNYDLYINGKTGTKAKILCMITPDVENHIIKILKEYFDDVVVVPYISWADNCDGIKILDLSRGNIDSNHAYSKVVTKLNIFNKNLFPYKKVIFVDSDLFPMGYYDSLFSLNTPAGVLEHRRIQKMEYGVDSWAYDRGQFVTHGSLIPDFLTDLTNSISADVNASLYVVEPNNNMFNEMIDELQVFESDFFSDMPAGEPDILTNLSKDINHKGFWLGNKFYNFYYLPEQNYLTKKFSGKWTSIDMGFSSWMIEMDHCFGFTFAGFVVKPWDIQTSFHNYSINPYSLFSKINNKSSNRSYGMQLFNNYVAKMISESKYKDDLIGYLKKIKILDFPIDTWEPEVNPSLCKYDNLFSYDFNHIYNLSPDQKRLYSLCNINNKKINTIIYYDYLFEKITREIYNLDFTMLSYQLFNIFNKTIEKLNMEKSLYPFGNTLNSINKYSSFDITDDDNDFILVLDKKKYKNKLIKLIEELLKKNLQVYFNKGDKTEFTQIVSETIKPVYFFKENNVDCIKYSDFIEKFDTFDFKFFNVSLYQSQLDKICEDLNINISNNMYCTHNNNNYVKVPWIDIFFIFDDKEKIGHMFFNEHTIHHMTFPANVNFIPTNDLFDNGKIKIKVANQQINNIDFKKFNDTFYENNERIENYIIKSKHNNLKNEREKIIKINRKNKNDSGVILFIYEFINKHIETIYKSFDIEKYIK